MTDQRATASRAATFRQLHDARTGFVMPNAWDAGTAVILAEAGFSAIATTSSSPSMSGQLRADHAKDRRQDVVDERVVEALTDAGDLVNEPSPVHRDLRRRGVPL